MSQEELLNKIHMMPVVFCRDCKWYSGREWENNETGTCARTDFGVSHDSYCSAAKLREEQT